VITDINEGQMVEAASKVHLEAFNGYLNARLGATYASALIDWFAHEKEAIAIAAVDGHDHVIGYAIGAPSHLVRVLRRDMFWVTVGSLVLRPWLLLDVRLWKVGTARLKGVMGPGDSHRSSDLPEPAMSLFGIGVLSSQRKTGVGLRLLQAFENKARTLGMRSLLLWVYEDKTATRRLYEKCGWRHCGGSPRSTQVAKYIRLLDTETPQA
jgi:GNAT superfamily N-acetyltransferase